MNNNNQAYMLQTLSIYCYVYSVYLLLRLPFRYNSNQSSNVRIQVTDRSCREVSPAYISIKLNLNIVSNDRIEIGLSVSRPLSRQTLVVYLGQTLLFTKYRCVNTHRDNHPKSDICHAISISLVNSTTCRSWILMSNLRAHIWA